MPDARADLFEQVLVVGDEQHGALVPLERNVQGVDRLEVEVIGRLVEHEHVRLQQHQPTEALSGGETARLLFCRLMLLKPNVLVLDEPTNHLDLEAINALNIALQRYEGTVLLVTHDEDLLEEVGTRVWHFEHGRIVDFKGTYEEAHREDGVILGEVRLKRH